MLSQEEMALFYDCFTKFHVVIFYHHHQNYFISATVAIKSTGN